MTIINFSSLCTSIADWINRKDLDSVIPTFVQLCESEINSDDRFRVLPSMIRTPITVDQQFISLPDDYISMQNLRIKQSPPPGSIEMVTLNQFEDLRACYIDGGIPKYYSIVGEEIEFLPSPDKSYDGEIVYYSKLSPLSLTNPTNWLLATFPNIYLYGSLLQAAPYLQDDSRLATWTALYNSAAEKINEANDRGQFSGSTLKVRTIRRYR